MPHLSVLFFTFLLPLDFVFGGNKVLLKKVDFSEIRARFWNINHTGTRPHLQMGSTLTPTPTSTLSQFPSIDKPGKKVPTLTPAYTPVPTKLPVVTITPTLKPVIPTSTPTQPPRPTSTPIPTATPTQQPTSLSVTDYMMNEINTFRKSKGLSVVKTDSYTCNFAQTRAQEITSNFNHDGFNQRVKNGTLPYSSYKLVIENLARAGKYQDVVRLWINSPTHSANLSADVSFACVGSFGDFYAYEGWEP